MSIKAYKYRIYANKAATEKLHWVLDRCRELYNAALDERKSAYHIASFGQMSVYVYEKIIWYNRVVYYSSVRTLRHVARDVKDNRLC